jgi:hypothetical protein
MKLEGISVSVKEEESGSGLGRKNVVEPNYLHVQRGALRKMGLTFLRSSREEGRTNKFFVLHSSIFKK